MKKIFSTFLLLNLFLTAATQTTGDYRSFSSGDWAVAANWQRFDGSNWINPAPSAPNSSSGQVYIISGHTITISTNITIDQIAIEAGATLTQNATITLNDDLRDDLAVIGTLKNS